MSVLPGPVWEPRPSPRFAVTTDPGPIEWSPAAIIGRGPGLTPLGDDIAAGYFAGRALFGARHADDHALVETLAAQTTSLSGTLLRLAVQGQLPEGAHRLLEDGDPEPLLSWGATSGWGLLIGLGLSGKRGGRVARSLNVPLPLDSWCSWHIEIRELVPDSRSGTSRVSGWPAICP